MAPPQPPSQAAEYCCWNPERLRQDLDRAWAEQGLRHHGRTQTGTESMINSVLANHAAAER